VGAPVRPNMLNMPKSASGDRESGLRLTERCRQRAGCRDNAKQRSVIRSEDDVGGRARVTRDEERVLRGG